MALSEQNAALLNKFLLAIEPIAGAYTDDSFTYLAVKCGDKAVLVTGSLLLNVSERLSEPMRFESTTMRAGHFRLRDIGMKRSDLLEKVCTGPFATPDGEVIFPANEGGAHGINYSPFHAAGLQNQARLDVLQLFGGPIADHIRQPDLDWELRAASPPYDGLSDLIGEFSLPPLNNQATLQVVASTVALIDKASIINENRAKLRLRLAAGLDPSKASVGIRKFQQGRVVERFRLDGVDFAWSRDGLAQLGDIEIEVAPGAVLHCFATYAEVAQHHYWVSDPSTFQNPRRAAFEACDPGLVALGEVFNAAHGRGADARKLEVAVSWLLWMLGFSPAHLGDMPRTQDAADIIVSAPNGNIAVIECTTGVLKAENKLALLHSRAQAVRRKLDQSNLGIIKVLPVIVSSRPMSELEPDLELAQRLGIVVIDREELARIHGRTLVLPSADIYFDEALASLGSE